jgi:hypothetical protein
MPLGAGPVIGYGSKTFIGWCAYHEPIPLIRHDVTGWEPIADQAAARAVPLEQVRRAGVTTVVPGTVKAARRPAAPTGYPGAQAGRGGGAAAMKGQDPAPTRLRRMMED